MNIFSGSTDSGFRKIANSGILFGMIIIVEHGECENYIEPLGREPYKKNE